MGLRLSAKNLKVTNGMKSHLKEKVNRLKKFATRLDAHAVLKKEKHIYRAELTVHTKNFDAFGEGRERENIFAAMDKAIERVAKQLQKHHDKVRDHHKGQKSRKLSPKEELARTALMQFDEDEELGPEVVKERVRKPKFMSVDRAIVKLDEMNASFLFFYNTDDDEQVAMVFRRPDGKYGLLEPQF